MTNPLSRLKGFLLRMTCPLFFRRIGRRSSFHGRTRLPLPLRNVFLGDDCVVGDSVYFQTGRHSEIIVGTNCSFNSGCHIIASERITIGDNVAIAEYVSIRDQEHCFSPDAGIAERRFSVRPVMIGSNVWIGRGAYIGPGTTIQNGSVVGANSVVHGEFPPNVLIAGAPAAVKKVFPDLKA